MKKFKKQGNLIIAVVHEKCMMRDTMLNCIKKCSTPTGNKYIEKLKKLFEDANER